MMILHPPGPFVFVGRAPATRIGLLMLTVLLCGFPPAVRAAGERPNIIIVMADDMGYSDLGCYGGEIETPHLDRLAADGLRFTQFYNTARCCPTRASLLTGLYSHQAGMGHMTRNDGIPAYQGYLNDRCVTIAEALRPAGYIPLMTGKWHVGNTRGRWPLDRGFDRFFGTPSGGGVYFTESLQIRKNVFFVENKQKIEVPDDFYVTDAFTDYALRFLEDASRTDKPFFLYLAHIAPHWPLQAKPADIAKYQGRYDAGWDAIREARYRKQLELGLVRPEWRLSPSDSRAQSWNERSAAQRRDLSHRMAVYAAQVDCIDQNIGRLTAKLRELGEWENTVFLFLSDNGCSAEGGPGGFSRGREGAPIGTGLSYASVGLEWANVSDTPFRKYKMDTHEGGIATPLIVHWPQGLPADRRGQLEQEPGHVIDLLPTCLDLAGVDYPTQRGGRPTIPPEGRSLVPALHGRSIEREALYWEHQGNKAIRVKNWKLVASRQGDWELYNLATDRTELDDLSRQHPETTAELQAKWKAWSERVGVQPWPAVRRRSGRK